MSEERIYVYTYICASLMFTIISLSWCCVLYASLLALRLIVVCVNDDDGDRDQHHRTESHHTRPSTSLLQTTKKRILCMHCYLHEDKGQLLLLLLVHENISVFFLFHITYQITKYAGKYQTNKYASTWLTNNFIIFVP